MIDYMMQFANAGFHVFPVFKSRRNPRGYIEAIGWNNNSNGNPKAIPATTDVGIIKTWEELDLHGYGVCAWKDFIIFDLDMKNGKNGFEAFDKIKDTFNVPAPELVVRSKTGGAHLYYRRHNSCVHKLMAAKSVTLYQQQYSGVDIVSDSGYVIGPTRRGDWVEGSYSIIKGDITNILPVVPTAISDELRVESIDLVDSLISANYTETPADIIREGRIPTTIPCGVRDTLLMSFIGVCKYKRLPKDTVSILVEQFLKNCELEAGETREEFRASVNPESKIDRVYGLKLDLRDPRVVAQELNRILIRLDEESSKCYEYIIADKNVLDLTPNVPKTRQMLAQDLTRYAKPLILKDGTESKKSVNPIDIALRTWNPSINTAAYTGMKPTNELLYTHPTTDKLIYNMYRPPFVGYTPKTDGAEFVRVFLDFVNWIFGDRAEFMLNWVGHLIQKPHVKMSIAPVLISEYQGVGKGIFTDVVARMISRKYFANVSMTDLASPHYIVSDLLLIQVNELAAASKSLRDRVDLFIEKIKDLITEPLVTVNPKGKSMKSVPSYANFIICTNNDNALRITSRDRRFDPIIIRHNKFNKEFTLVAKTGRGAEFCEQLRADNIYALREYFKKLRLTVDLEHAHSSMSDDKHHVIQQGMPPLIRDMSDYIEDPENRGVKEDIVTANLLKHVATKLGYTGNQLGYLLNNLNEYKLIHPIYQAKLAAEGKFRPRRLTRLYYIDENFASISKKDPTSLAVFTIRHHGKYDTKDNSVVKLLYNNNVKDFTEESDAPF